MCLFLFCYAMLCVYSSFSIILKRMRKLVALLLLSYRCIVTINVLWLFLMVPLVGLLYVIGYILTYSLRGPPDAIVSIVLFIVLISRKPNNELRVSRNA